MNIVMRTEESKKGLRDLIVYLTKNLNSLKQLTLLEIGAFAGDSTEIFCENFGHVITIDPWLSEIGDVTNSVDMNKVYEVFLKRTSNFDNLTTIRGFSHNVYDKFEKNSIDVLYVDGAHDYDSVKQDILLYKNIVKKGGFICGHDYRFNKFKGVVLAINETLGKPDYVFKDTSWAKKW